MQLHEAVAIGSLFAILTWAIYIWRRYPPATTPDAEQLRRLLPGGNLIVLAILVFGVLNGVPWWVALALLCYLLLMLYLGQLVSSYYRNRPRISPRQFMYLLVGSRRGLE